MTTIQYTAFNRTTGAVMHCGSCSPEDFAAHAQLANGEILVGGWYDPDTYYMDLETDKIEMRERFKGFESPLVAVGDVFAAHGLPKGTMVLVDQQDPVQIDDGELEIEPQHTGPFRVKIWGPRICNWEGVVDAY